MPAQRLKAVRNLRSVGVEFSIQSVVTLHNLSSMDAVARFAADEGARVMQLVPFKDVRNPITSLSNSDLRLDDNSVVNEICDRLSRAHRQPKIERFVEASNSGGFHCDIGQTKLLMLPDGVVHRCYKLTSDASLRGADLKQVSLARAWHDPAFVDITLPPARAYAQTVCGSCGSKPNCDTSGRCIYDALINHGRYASPDRNCAGRARLRRPTITISDHPRVQPRVGATNHFRPCRHRLRAKYHRELMHQQFAQWRAITGTSQAGHELRSKHNDLLWHASLRILGCFPTS